MAVGDINELRHDILGLFKYIDRVKQEVATMVHRPDEENYLDNMGDQLDAVLQGTEQATHSIMEMMEKNDDLLDELRKLEPSDAMKTILDKIQDNGITVMEACAFQDITGQRISKVAKSLNYVEARVAALVDFVGEDELEEVDVGKDTRTEDEKLLNGPQMAEQAMLQSEIDSLFD